MYDLAIRDGTIVTPDGSLHGDVYVDQGKVAVISQIPNVHSADRTVNALGKIVFPGVIDPHVHLVSSARSFEENCRGETVSMVLGGVTTAVTYVNDLQSYARVLPEYRRTAEANSTVDLAFHVVIMKEEHLADMASCVKEFGVRSFKFFMGAGGSELYRNVHGVDDGILYEGMRAISEVPPPRVAMVHAENWMVIAMLQKKLKAEGKSDQAAWSDSRPDVCEEEAILKSTLFAAKRHCPLYIDHVSSTPGFEAALLGRRVWSSIYTEVTPHHLTFTRDSQLPVGVVRCNPPLRTLDDVERLWKGVHDGSVSCIGSDHIPHGSIIRDPPQWNVWAPALEIAHLHPGSGLILPVMFTEGFRKRNLPLERIAEVCSSRAAKIFGLATKGLISPGADADLVVFDPRKEVTFTPETLQLTSNFSWYEGWKFSGWPVTTVIRGSVVASEGELIEKPGFGKYVPRGPIPDGPPKGR